jgi:hypothetical protein
MNRYRLLPIGTVLIFALTAQAQQPKTRPGTPAKAVPGPADASLPTVEAQLKVLTEKPGLTNEQQGKVKAIVQELHDATLKLVGDKSMSSEERLAKVRPHRDKADERIRALLNEDQKKKLDQYEQGPHPEVHGSLRGATPPPRPPQI